MLYHSESNERRSVMILQFLVRFSGLSEPGSLEAEAEAERSSAARQWMRIRQRSAMETVRRVGWRVLPERDEEDRAFLYREMRMIWKDGDVRKWTKGRFFAGSNFLKEKP